jgi:hypothetical protein
MSEQTSQKEFAAFADTSSENMSHTAQAQAIAAAATLDSLSHAKVLSAESAKSAPTTAAHDLTTSSNAAKT